MGKHDLGHYKRLSLTSISGLAIFLVGLQPQLIFSAELPEVGEFAPEFEMVGSDGETYKLCNFRGKQAVILAWYPKAFTGG